MEEGEGGISRDGEGSTQKPDVLGLLDLQLSDALELPRVALHRDSAAAALWAKSSVRTERV